LPISDKDKQRINMMNPVSNDVKLGDIVQGLQSGKASDISVSAIDGVTATNVQAVLAELAGRIAALEV